MVLNTTAKMLFVLLLCLSLKGMVLGSSITYEDYDLSLSTFQLVEGPGDGEMYELGTVATLKFEFQTTTDIEDTLTMEFSSFYNGYSALIICGVPTIEAESDYELEFSSLDDIAPHTDTMYLDFGQISWGAGTVLSITFNIMLIKHKDYVEGDTECCYWFAAAMQYNHEGADWVSDIAFKLAPLPSEVGGVLAVEESPENNILFDKGGSGRSEIEVTVPFAEVESFQFSAKLDPLHAEFDNLCLCGLSLIDASMSYKGCGESVLPPYAIFEDPPFNDTSCKTEITLDFGNLKKVGVSMENDVLKFFLVYRTLNDFEATDPMTLSGLIDYKASGVDVAAGIASSGSVNVVKYSGSLNDVDVVNVGFSYAGPVLGSAIAAYAFLIPMATSINRLVATIELQFPSGSLEDVHPKLVLTERGSCCMPEIEFEITDVDSRTKKASATFNPVSFMYGGESQVKLAIVGTVAAAFSSQAFTVTFSVQGNTCSSCKVTRYISTVDEIAYDPTYFPRVEIGTFDKLGGGLTDSVEIFQSGFGHFHMVVTMDAAAPAHELFQLKAGFLMDTVTHSTRLLHLSQAYVTHVGDNFPLLQKEKRSIEVKAQIETVAGHLPFTKSVLEFTLPESITYLPLNGLDVMDRRIVLSVYFRLPPSESLAYYWKETVLGFLSLDDYREDVVSGDVAAVLDIETQTVIPTGYSTQETLMNAFEGDIFRASLWPTNEDLDTVTESVEIIPYEERVVVFKMYITTAHLYNDYTFNFSVNGFSLPFPEEPFYGKSDSTNTPKISHVYLKSGPNVEFFYDDSFQQYRFGSRNLFKNETKDDYEVMVFVHVLGPATDTLTGAIDLNLEFSATLFTAVDTSVALQTTTVKVTPVAPSVSSAFSLDATYNTDGGFTITRNVADEGVYALEPTPGGTFARWLDLRVPQQTLGEFVLQLNVSSFSVGANEAVGLWTMGVVSAGSNIGIAFNRSTVSIAERETQLVDDSEFVTYMAYDLGIVQNLYPNKVDYPVDIPENIIKLVVQVHVGLNVSIGDSFNLTAILRNSRGDSLVAKYSERITISDDCPTLVPMYTRSPRNTLLAFDEYEVAPSASDFAIPIQVEFPPFFNGEPMLHLASALHDDSAQFVIRGVELDEAFPVGDEITSSLPHTSNKIEEEFFLSEDVDRQFEESTMMYRLGRVSSLDSKQRGGLYALDGFAAASRARTVQFLVFVQVQDLPSFAPDDVFTLYWTVSTVNSVVMAQKKFLISFEAARRPLLNMDIQLSHTLEREFAPGEPIQFTVELFHKCESNALADDVRILVYLPSFVQSFVLNETHHAGKLPSLDFTPNDTQAELWIERLSILEYLEFRYIIEVTAGLPGISDERDYRVTTPIDVVYRRLYRDTDEDEAGQVYHPKSFSASTMFVVSGDTNANECATKKIPIADGDLFQPCQVTSSSSYDKENYPVKQSLRSVYTTGWRSSTWEGQWSKNQYIKVALLQSYQVLRIRFHKDSSFASFYFQYSNDPEGIYWNDYYEQNAIRIFLANQSYPDATNPLVRYVSIRDPVYVKWVKIVFADLNRETDLGKRNVFSFRFDLMGCKNEIAPEVDDLSRACPIGASIQEVYDRGFITDPVSKVLFVCEKNLEEDQNECFKMTLKPSNTFAWSPVDQRIHSIIGFWIPYQTLFAVSQTQKTYLGSDDGGRTWLTVQTQEFWTAAGSGEDYKEAVLIPYDLSPVDVDNIPDSLRDGWDGVVFGANNEGIWKIGTEGVPEDHNMTYCWSQCCN